MKSRDSAFPIWYIILGSFIIALCTSCSSQDQSKKETEQIKNRIQIDLTNTTSKNSLELSLPELPSYKYTVDKAHSSISFRTKHWEIVDIIGWFSDFNIIMYSDDKDFTDAVIYAEVFIESIIMPNEKMMESAKKYPYLDSENFPKMTFTSSQMNKIEGNKYSLRGMLNVNGVSKQTEFTVTSNGFAYPNEQSICGFDINGEINRHDFNIAGNSRLHSGRKIHDDIIYLNFALRME
jgi:polyisoprenoid-binding protein YceI